MGIELIPSTFTGDTQGEYRTLRALERVFDDAERVTVFAGTELFDGASHGEYDFIVCIPDAGIAVLEVKDSDVKFEGDACLQLNRNTRKYDRINPHQQLHKAMKAIRQALRSKSGYHTPLPPIVSWLVTPDTEFAADFEHPLMPRANIIDKVDLDNIATILRNALQFELAEREAEREFTTADLAQLRDRFAMDEADYEDFVHSAGRRGRTVERLSREQAAILPVLDENRRLYVRGGPGTGKSVLALEQALRLASDGSKVALLSFNRGLAEFQRLQMEHSEASAKPDFVGAIYDHLPAHLGVRLPEPPGGLAENKQHFDEKVPKLMAEFLSRQGEDARFDAVVIDEAQDLNEHGWNVVMGMLRDPGAGLLHAFGDAAQDMWGQSAREPGFWAYARLHDNLRCTKRIAEFIQAYDPEAPTPLSIDPGWHVEVLQVADVKDVEDAAMKYARELTDMYEWAAGDIAVLSTGGRLAEYVRQRGSGDEEVTAYWRRAFEGKEVLYGSTLSFKGLDRPAVVLALNGFPDVDAVNIASILLVGISRARDQLTIVGTAEDLQRLGDALKETVEAEVAS